MFHCFKFMQEKNDRTVCKYSEWNEQIQSDVSRNPEIVTLAKSNPNFAQNQTENSRRLASMRRNQPIFLNEDSKEKGGCVMVTTVAVTWQGPGRTAVM